MTTLSINRSHSSKVFVRQPKKAATPAGTTPQVPTLMGLVSGFMAWIKSRNASPNHRPATERAKATANSVSGDRTEGKLSSKKAVNNDRPAPSNSTVDSAIAPT